jgi:hypothetical protein
VGEQVNGAERGAAAGEVAGGVHQRSGDEVVRVFAEFVHRQVMDEMGDGARADNKQERSADDLRDSVQALQDQADLERPVQCLRLGWAGRLGWGGTGGLPAGHGRSLA